MKNLKIPMLTRTHEKTQANEKIGFGYVPDQIRKKSQSEGFYLNILMMGRRGLGTTTLINSLFKSPLLSKDRDNEINVFKNEIYENDICLRTTITTCHNTDVAKISNYLEKMNEEYFEIEQGLSKPKLDPRIHLCIYMIPDDELKNDEIRMMKELSKRCNFLPVIAKADAYTQNELLEYKDKIIKLLIQNEIQIFTPELMEEDDDEFVGEMQETISKYPLAIIASVETHERNNEIKFGRFYSWGFVDTENEEISDFLKLRKLIINNCLDDLIFTTDAYFYNSYRKVHMESERIDEVLRKNRLIKIKCEMEKILKERNEKKLQKILDDIAKLEKDYNDKIGFIETEQKFNNALNSAQ